MILPSSVQRVLDIVNNVESMPSCAKIATSNLMHSCSTLEGSFLNEDADMNRGSDLFIADEMGLYAARLAVCELNEADSLIPTGCEAFIPTQRTKKQSGFRGFWTGSGPTQPNPSYAAYDDLTQAQSKHCISALYTIPQAWMSFSNSKQNAVTMCRAMRSEIDKEEQLHIAKILSESAVAASGSLHDAFEQANGLIAQFVELRSLMRNFHINVADGNQKELERVEYIWGYLNRIQEAASEVESTIDHLRDDARAAHIDVADLRSEIQSTGATAAVVLNEVVAEATTGTDLTVKNFNKIHEMAEVVKTVEQENLKSIMDLSYHISAASATAESIAGSFLTLRDAHDRNLETMLQKEKDLNELLEKNRGVIGQTTEALEELDSTARSLLSGLGIEWASARELLHKTSTFAVHVAVYTLLGFGVWEKLIRASLMGTIFAALGTAISKSDVLTIPMCSALLTLY